MRQMSLKLKSYKGMVNIIQDSDFSLMALYVMLMSFMVLGFCYTLIVGSMVFDIVERKSLEKEILTLSNEVGALELSYFSLSNKVNLDLSYSMGFKEIKPSFATRKAVGLSNPSVTIRNEI